MAMVVMAMAKAMSVLTVLMLLLMMVMMLMTMTTMNDDDGKDGDDDGDDGNDDDEYDRVCSDPSCYADSGSDGAIYRGNGQSLGIRCLRKKRPPASNLSESLLTPRPPSFNVASLEGGTCGLRKKRPLCARDLVLTSSQQH